MSTQAARFESIIDWHHIPTSASFNSPDMVVCTIHKFLSHVRSVGTIAEEPDGIV